MTDCADLLVVTSWPRSLRCPSVTARAAPPPVPLDPDALAAPGAPARRGRRRGRSSRAGSGGLVAEGLWGRGLGGWLDGLGARRRFLLGSEERRTRGRLPQGASMKSI